jgi:hypothetical protein
MAEESKEYTFSLLFRLRTRCKYMQVRSTVITVHEFVRVSYCRRDYQMNINYLLAGIHFVSLFKILF